MNALRILVIPGSVRAGSFNRQLARAAIARLGELGHAGTELDLRALNLPVYDGDIEASSGVPGGAHELLAAVQAHDALLLVTPEYNGFPTPLVINAFDWLSRISADGARVSGLASTANKPVALLSASPGPLGGLRAMNFLRQYLQMAFAMIVVPQQFALGKANEAFDDAGRLKDERSGQAVDGVLHALVRLANGLQATPR